jgi:ketosteroid isomerase-like protein
MDAPGEPIRRIYDAFNRRDLDAYLAFMADDVEALPRLAAMEGAYNGHDGVRRWWSSTLIAFPDLTLELVLAEDVGEALVTAVHMSAHGVDTGTPVDQVAWTAITMRDGLVTWWAVFNSREEAVAAAETASRA